MKYRTVLPPVRSAMFFQIITNIPSLATYAAGRHPVKINFYLLGLTLLNIKISSILELAEKLPKLCELKTTTRQPTWRTKRGAFYPLHLQAYH